MAQILWYVIVGGIIGVIARALLPGRDPIGFLGTIVLGIVGAVIGGYAYDAIFPGNESRGVDVIAAIIVATLLLFLYRKFAGGRSTVR